MNERIRELAEKARIKDHWSIDEGRYLTNYLDEQKFAELIVREGGEAFWSEACHVSDLAYEEYSRNSKKIKQHFGVEECRGWVCPKCGVDRTKDVCPQGHMAAVEGKCPMIGVAQ